MSNIKQAIIDRITSYLMEQDYYREWLGTVDGQIRDNHNGVVKSLHRINDTMLLAVYERIVSGAPLIPCLADQDGQYLNIKIGRYYGGMVSDGSIHT